MRTIATLALIAATGSGCGGAGVPDASMNAITEAVSDLVVTGAIYVDFHVDAPCDVTEAPPELSGVVVRFHGPDGRSLGEGTTGPIRSMVLPFGEGKRGWTHPGCRYSAPYSAPVVRAVSYEASFDAPAQEFIGAGSWFTGVDELQPQVISHEDLESRGFAWDFEAGPSYVVGH